MALLADVFPQASGFLSVVTGTTQVSGRINVMFKLFMQPPSNAKVTLTDLYAQSRCKVYLVRDGKRLCCTGNKLSWKADRAYKAPSPVPMWHIMSAWIL